MVVVGESAKVVAQAEMLFADFTPGQLTAETSHEEVMVLASSVSEEGW